MAIRSPSRPHLGILMLLVLLLPILAACAGTAATPAPTGAPGTTAPSAEPSEAAGGGIMTAAWIGPCCLDVDTNNVLTAGGDYHWWNKIHTRLFTYTVKDQQYGELVGELADTWSVADDQLTWTIKIRDGVVWHDGTPLTAEDVKFSMELCLDPATGGCTNAGFLAPIAGAKEFQDGASEVTGIKVVDDVTFTVTTSTPNATLLDGFAETWILPKHSLGAIPRDQVKDSDWWTTQQIGAGPFKWSKYTPGQSIELVRNDTYYRGAPKLDGIIRRQFKDPATALLAFEAGEIDFTYVTADEVARQRESTIGTIFEGPSGVDNVFYINTVKNPEFKAKELRQALMYATDRKTIVDTIYGGAAALVPCLYGNPRLTGSVEPYPYDPAKAKQLWDANGGPTGKSYAFDTYYNDPLSANVMTAIQQNLKDNLGIDLGLEPMDPSAWTERYYNQGQSDFSFAGAANGPTGNRAFQYHHSSSPYPTGNNGFTGYFYDNPELDALLEAGAAEFDPAKSDAIYQEACALMNEELPWNYLWQTIRYHIVSNKLQNVILIPAPGGGSYYDAVETWTKSE